MLHGKPWLQFQCVQLLVQVAKLNKVIEIAMKGEVAD